jgi:hypothetical protein
MITNRAAIKKAIFKMKIFLKDLIILKRVGTSMNAILHFLKRSLGSFHKIRIIG